MKIFLFLMLLFHSLIKAQNIENFFPHDVGNRWEYIDQWGQLYTQTITKDSIGPDSSHNLFYNNFLEYPRFRIDTAFNVFRSPKNINFLAYKLKAKMGDIWENSVSGSERWAWIVREETSYVFSKLTTIKIIRYSPGYPDSINSPGLYEEWLADGFGLVYQEGESGFGSLRGCIISQDTFGIVTSIKREEELPVQFLLKQNYPNPFNPLTTIELELPNEAELSISIYNILGQQVDILYEGLNQPGNFKIQWDAAGLASGIYFCRTIANGNVKTIKMILTK